MKSRKEEQKTSETKKPRFKIEKLEERIAPRHSCHYKYKGRTGIEHGHCYGKVPPGWYKNGKA